MNLVRDTVGDVGYDDAVLTSFQTNQRTPGKSRWHSYHVLVYISPVLTYLLGTTVPCTLVAKLQHLLMPRFRFCEGFTSRYGC